MTHIWQCIFLSLLSNTVPALAHGNILNNVGDILYEEAKRSVRDLQRSHYFIPYSNYSLDQDCINTHN